MPTLTELTAAADAADQRARKARAEGARLRREIERTQAARLAAQERLVGATVLRWCQEDDRTRAGMVRYLRGHLSEAVDLDLLRGSVLDPGALENADGVPNDAAERHAEEQDSYG